MVEPAGREDHPTAGADAQHTSVAFHHRTGHGSVGVGDQFGHRRVQPQRDAAVFHRQAQPGRQRLPDRRHPLAEHACPEHPPQQLHQNGFAAPVLAHLVEEAKVFGAQPDSLWCQRQGLKQVLLLVAELAQVDGRHVDRAAPLGAAGQFRVVVGVAGFPDELEPRARLLQELHHLRRGVDVSPQPGVADDAAGDLAQVFHDAVRRRVVAFPALGWRTGHPDSAARQRGGTAEVVRLFDDQSVAALMRRRPVPPSCRRRLSRRRARRRTWSNVSPISESRSPDGESGDQLRGRPVVAMHRFIPPLGGEGGESGYPGADFVCGVAGLLCDPLVLPRVEFRQVASVQDVRAASDPIRRSADASDPDPARTPARSRSLPSAAPDAVRASSGRPWTMRSSAAGGAVASVGTGGSWDSPPDPSNSTRLPSVAANRPTAAPSARARFSGPSGVATELMKIGTIGRVAASPNSVCSGWTVP